MMILFRSSSTLLPYCLISTTHSSPSTPPLLSSLTETPGRIKTHPTRAPTTGHPAPRPRPNKSSDQTSLPTAKSSTSCPELACMMKPELISELVVQYKNKSSSSLIWIKVVSVYKEFGNFALDFGYAIEKCEKALMAVVGVDDERRR
ncbi:hypothetical protein GQ457_03G039050 [Hibiscus cannabinus]